MTKLLAAAVVVLGTPAFAAAADLESRVKEGFADSAGVKIHYATLGSGPLVVMIHGFPDYWYTWRHQMEGLADTFQVVAIDQRGYNKSDKPAGVASYVVPLLVSDVIAVIKHLGKDKAVVVGHDWGGVVAWSLAMEAPQLVDKLVILNLPHPRGLFRELAGNPSSRRTARTRGASRWKERRSPHAEGLAGWVKDPAAKAKYVEAFGRSDFAAMLSYYKANYPREPYVDDSAARFPKKVQCPVLAIHG
jgi:pimeloyl-ACP methyl ester carboxylesterase